MGRRPLIVERLRDLEDEVIALADEGRDVAEAVRRLARLGQTALVAGHSPATVLDRIERLASRHETAMAAIAARAKAARSCPDVIEVVVGHGEAA